MELSERELTVLTAETDAMHRDGMADLPEQIHELHRQRWPRPQGLPVATGTLLTIGALTVPLLAFMSPAAAAGGDAGLAAYAESVELAAVAAYQAAAASGKVTTKAIADAATLFAGHHTEHAAAFGAAAGAAATKKANPKLVAAVSSQLTAAKTEMDIVNIAYGLENAAAATYLFALGALTSKAALALTASILPVESQHAVVLGQVLGKSGTDLVPGFETATAALSPDTYPI
jgi:hypothetical protein